MVSRAFHLKDSASFVEKALHWASGFDSACCLDSNGFRDNYGKISVFLAVGEQAYLESDPTQGPTFERLQHFVDSHPNTWIPGYLGYDLKNELENLSTQHPNRTGFADAYFFLPAYTLLIGQYNVEIRGEDPERIIAEIDRIQLPDTEMPVNFKGSVQQRMPWETYKVAFDRIQQHIHQGDCYEVNLCQEFYAESASLHPLGAYKRLNRISPTPFSCFFKRGNQYILSASPERFLSKQGSTLLSQPIKGTAPRGKNTVEDAEFKRQLETSPKERSENVMIVDLVRNDLTRSAKASTVRTTELAKAYSFKQVHQLISTICCEIHPEIPTTQAIAYAFPPGSMTGAPKVRVMEIIDACENARRGVYSGGLGYFGPQGNFDFSVVIRTLIYNADTGYLSFHTGGAITAGSDAEAEYKECLLKGKAIFEILQN